MPGSDRAFLFTGVASVPKTGPEGSFWAVFQYYRPTFGDGGHMQSFGLDRRAFGLSAIFRKFVRIYLNYAHCTRRT